MEKIVSHKQLRNTVTELKHDSKTIVFTNGCFDILHAGHAAYLNMAKQYGDILIVALNSDTSVRSIKGAPRPLVPQEDRAYLIASLEAVDFVTFFDEDTPLKLIEYLKPEILIKGGDWKEEEVVGRHAVKKWGGKVVIIPEIEGKSTTNIIDKIREVYNTA